MNDFLKKYPTFKSFPITWTIIALNIFYFLIQTVSGGSTNTGNLVRLGAKFDYGIAQGEYWRLLSATFLHIGVIHLILNLAGLFIFGRLIEKEFLRFRYVIIYLFAGISSSIFSYWSGSAFISIDDLTNCNEGLGSIGAGASGAIFGLLGCYAAFLMINKNVLGSNARESLISIGILVFINVVYGATASNIDQVAHVSGLICGFAIGWLLSPAKQMIILPDTLVEKSILVSLNRNNLSKLFIVSFVILIIIISMAYFQRTQFLNELSDLCRLDVWYKIK
ncbi:MAG: rhomboid family intramembrane serine protease [Chloroflexota bacterium]|nr:rhomboid family intramembrane serine protease [Chloroflexota bacterium]